MTRLARPLRLILLLSVLLGASACGGRGATKSIGDLANLDADGAARVGAALLSGETIGNAAQATELGGAMKDFRRADHEQRGEVLLRAGDYAGAVEEYHAALQWTGDGLAHDLERAALEVRLANALSLDAIERRAADRAIESARHFDRAAELRQRDAAYAGSSRVADLRANAAAAYYLGGEYSAACEALRRARTLGFTDTFIGTALQAQGRTCA